MTPSFDALAPHYNAWMLPGVAILLALGAQELARRWPLLAWAVIFSFIWLNISGSRLLVRGEYFTHGPDNAIRRILKNIPARHTAIVIDDNREWAALYFPLRYELGPNPLVFLASVTDGAAYFRRVEPDSNVARASVMGYDFLLLVRAQSLRTRDISKELDEKSVDIAESSLLEQVRSDSHWREIDKFRQVAFVGATGHLFARMGM
jgi:hypothetical protein